MPFSLLLPVLSAFFFALFYAFARRRSSVILKPLPRWPEYPCRLITETGVLSRPEISRSHFAVRNAQIMALTHNTMSRGLNAICAQALAVKPGTKDATDILLYASIVHDFIHDHHLLEEHVFFPRIEAATGQNGLMEENLEQHKTLESGLEALRRYATKTTAEQYDGTELRRVIENLAGCLVQHLHDEISSILNLWDKISSEELERSYRAMHDEAAKKSNLFRAAPFVFGCEDKTFLMDEQSIDFPEVPTYLVHYIVDWFVSKRHAGAWRFSPSTVYAEPKMTEFWEDTRRSKSEKSAERGTKMMWLCPV